MVSTTIMVWQSLKGWYECQCIDGIPIKYNGDSDVITVPDMTWLLYYSSVLQSTAL